MDKLDFLDKAIIDANEQYSKYGESKIFKKICNKIIDTNDAELNYIFAREVRGVDAKAHGKVVLRNGNVQTNFLFGMDVVGADVEAHIAFLEEHNRHRLALKLQREHTPINEL